MRVFVQDNKVVFEEGNYLQEFPCGGALLAVAGSITDMITVNLSSPAQGVIVEYPYQGITDSSDAALDTTAALTIIALNAIFDTLTYDSVVVRDITNDFTGITKIVHQVDRDSGGTVEFTKQTATLGLYDTYLTITEADLSNTAKATSYGKFQLFIQEAGAGSGTEVFSFEGVPVSEGVTAGVYATIRAEELTFTGGSVVFTSSTSGINYSDLTGAPAALDGDLVAIAALAGTTGLLRKNAADTWALDNAAYITSYTVTEGDVTSHEAALAIAQSQVTGLVTSLGLKADTSSLATVATTGAYSDLTGTPSGAGALDGLSDVTITAAAANDILYYSGSAWVDTNIQQLITSQVDLRDLKDVTVASTPADGDVMSYDLALSKWEPRTPSGGGTSFPSDHMLWEGTSSSLPYFTLTNTTGWIDWTTLNSYIDVNYDSGSNVNAALQYVVPANGYYEMNFFCMIQNQSGAAETFSLIAGIRSGATTMATVKQIIRTSISINNGANQGLGGTGVFYATSGTIITPGAYILTDGSATYRFYYGKAALHGAIRRIA